jgi:hypothetical protein
MATKSATFLYLSGKYHKIEGLENKPGAARGITVETDDENLGVSIYMIGEQM